MVVLCPHLNGRQKTSNANLKDDIQKVSNASFDATNHSFERVTKATQAIVSEITDYSKRSFENGTKAMENVLGVRSLDKAFEVQSEYARTAYEGYVSHASKLGQLYTNLAKEAFQPYLLRIAAPEGQLQRCPLLMQHPRGSFSAARYLFGAQGWRLCLCRAHRAQ